MTRSRRAGAAVTFVVLTASLSLPASAVAAAPVAGAEPATTREDVQTTVTLVGIDGDGDPTTFELTTPPLLGTLGELGARDCDGNVPQTCMVDVQYTPSPDVHGLDGFGFSVSDGAATVTATANVAVTSVNDAPTFTAGADQVVLEDAGPRSIPGWATAISAGPSNEAGQAVSFVVVAADPALFSTQPAVSPSGQLTFTPAPDANGSTNVSATLHDSGGIGNGGADVNGPQSFTIQITAVNDPPQAVDDTISVDEDSGVTVLDLLANDDDAPDAGETLTIVAVSDPSQGSASLSGGKARYTTVNDYAGADDFTYTISDGHGGTDSATVHLSVDAVNDQPTADPDAYQMAEDSTLTRSAAQGVLVGDADVDAGTTLSAVLVGDAAHGTLTLAASGSFNYTPGADYTGNDSFTYRASDGVALSALATVTITVSGVNDEPRFTKGAAQVVLEDSGARTVAGWASAIVAGPPNESGQVVSFQVVGNTNPSLLSAGPVIASNGTLTFTPAANASGSAIITVRAHDDGGTASGGDDTSPTQTFTISVAGVNDAPSFTKGANQTVAEDSGLRTVAGWASAIVMGPANEAAQGQSFSVTTTNAALFAGAPAVSSSGTLTFTPAPNRSGSATITVRLKDTGGTANGGVDTSAPRTATIRVTSVNDPPTASNDLAEVEAGSPATSIEVLANDSAAPDSGETLRVDAIIGSPSHGTATIDDDDAALAYQPAVGFSGVDTFTYRLSDGHGGTDTATVRVTVTADVTDPTVTTPRATIVSGVTAGTSTIKVRQTWMATDGSGIASTGLARSVDGAPYATVTLPTTTATAADQDLAFGPAYRYRARAADPAGNVSGWSTGPAMFLRRYQDDSPSITYAGGTWTRRTVAGATGGTVRFATRARASASLTITGRAAALIAQREKTSGSVEVWVDGVRVATIDLKVASPKARQVVWSRAWTTNASRTIKLVLVGNGRVDIDAIVILRDPV